MYPLHKYLPTPFGTYMLYIDNGPTRVKVNNDKIGLPSYQKVKEYGRQQQQQQQQQKNALKYQAFQNPVPDRASAPVETRHQSGGGVVGRKKQSYTPSSNMPTSIWSPKVKRPHLSYNMRQLWHTGQPMKDTPSNVVKVDEVTGAELLPEAQWFKGRSSRTHEEMMAFTSFKLPNDNEDAVKRSNLFMRADDILHTKRLEHAEQLQISVMISDSELLLKQGKSRSRVPPNTAANSPEAREAYKRRASSLRNDMVPKMNRKPKRVTRSQHNPHRQHNAEDGYIYHQLNKETQTSPMRSAKTSMERCKGDIFPGISTPITPQRSTSKLPPNETPKPAAEENRTLSCVQKTGLPPIFESEAPKPQETKTAPLLDNKESDKWQQRLRRVQEFRSASPTFPIRSKGAFWEEVSRGKIPRPGNHGLLPFSWKEPTGFTSDTIQHRQQRALEVEKILPTITRMSSVPRVAAYRA